VKIIQACSAAGGLTPNKAKQIIYEALGEVSEDYEGDWGEIPLAYSKGSTGTDTLSNLLGVSTAIQKAHNNHDDDVVPVLQAIKKYLQRLEHDKKE
jgi:hypothetical protein